MNLRQIFSTPSSLIRVGSASLIVASALKFFVHPAASSTQDLLDGVMGCGYGITIACYLLAIRIKTRRPPQDVSAA
jgi:hypothetical protein